MNSKMKIRSIIAKVLVVIMIVTLLPGNVLAETQEKSNENQEVYPRATPSQAEQRGEKSEDYRGARDTRIRSRSATPSEATPSEATPSEATPSEAVEIIVNDVNPGTLRTAIENHPDFISWDLIKALTISGSLDGYDFYVFRSAEKSLERVDLRGIDNTELPYLTFSGCLKLTEVILPDSMIYISPNAFDGCYNLLSLDLSNVTYIGQRAFEGCKKLTLAEGTNLSSVKYISNFAFWNCKQLSGVDLSNVTSIGQSAFRGCVNLTLAEGTNLSSGLNVIPLGVFDGCENLTGVDLSNVTFVDNYAFFNCKKLTLADGTNLSSVEIGRYAFQGCEQLTGVDLSSVISLGEGSFADCKNLTLADGTNLSDNIKEISWGTFSGCERLTQVDLSNVTRLGYGAFRDCTHLTEVDLSNVTSLSSDVFYNCENLTLADGGNLSSELNYISEGTFYGCKRLTGVDLSNVTDISRSAFYGCESLTAIDISKLTRVSDKAFNGCNNLRAVALPKEKPEIHEDVFTVPLLLLVNGGGIYEELDEFPENSSYPFILGASAIPPGDALTLSVSPDGGDGISYQWYLNQSLLPGKTERTLTISNAQKSNGGIYTCEIRLGSVSQRISKTVTINSSRSSGSGGSSSSSMNAGFWVKDSVGWWYQLSDGTYPKLEWKQINKEWYYFEASGYLKAKWLLQDDKWYWLDPGSGKMVKSDWVLYQDNWYYIGDDGTMQTGWQEYKNAFYYLSKENDSLYGHMLRNATTPDGYTVDENGVRISPM